MKTGRVRASAPLAGVAIACAIPAVAWGQLDPNKVGDTVNGVTQQAPQVPSQVQKQLPKLPATPVTKSPGGGSSNSTPNAQAPAGGGGGGSTGSSAPSSSSSSRSTGSNASGSTGAGAVKAHAASSKKQASASKGSVSGQSQANPADKQTKVASVSAARPASGIQGDPKLPFTGYALIVVGALGLMALLTGAGLRGASRLRFARRRA